MSEDEGKPLFEAVKGKPISLWEAIPVSNRGVYTVVFRNLSGETEGNRLLTYKEFEQIRPKGY